MSLKILFVSRMNADFERWVSLADYLHDKMDVHISKRFRATGESSNAFHTPRGGMKLEYANLCFVLDALFLTHRKIFITFFRIGQVFRNVGQRLLKARVENYLDKLNPDAIFILPI